MAITGGFGTMMDLERGTSRQWVMGRDGVRRWADSGEPVDVCTYPKCRCPFDATADTNWCAIGLPHKKEPNYPLSTELNIVSKPDLPTDSDK